MMQRSSSLNKTYHAFKCIENKKARLLWEQDPLQHEEVFQLQFQQNFPTHSFGKTTHAHTPKEREYFIMLNKFKKNQSMNEGKS